MSLLRVHISLADSPDWCQWVLIHDSGEFITGEGLLTELPHNGERVQLVLPAAQVLLTRVNLPKTARHDTESALAFAVEEQTAAEPDSNKVIWLGKTPDNDVVAVLDKPGLARWSAALDVVGIHGYEVHCETLLLPWVPGEWSIVWCGREGFIRTGEFEGTATDSGDRKTPPLLLRLLLEQKQALNQGPSSIALYTSVADTAPDIEVWSRELEIPVHLSGHWDWRAAPPDAGVCLIQQRRRWRMIPADLLALRPAAWILGITLFVHALALIIDWTSLANEQHDLRQQMESRFRTTFPEAVAVVDPTLQMQRKLVEARHAAGQSDSSDFLPLILQLVTAVKELPAGTVRVVSYDGGRMTVELSAVDKDSLLRIVERMTQAGLNVETPPVKEGSTSQILVVTVQLS